MKKKSKNSYIKKLGEKAKNASFHLSSLNIKKRNLVLKLFKRYLKKYEKSILKANKIDLNNAKSKKISQNMLERLSLNKSNYGI